MHGNNHNNNNNNNSNNNNNIFFNVTVSKLHNTKYIYQVGITPN